MVIVSNNEKPLHMASGLAGTNGLLNAFWSILQHFKVPTK
mgnify:CR=1 FL=1